MCSVLDELIALVSVKTAFGYRWKRLPPPRAARQQLASAR